MRCTPYFEMNGVAVQVSEFEKDHFCFRLTTAVESGTLTVDMLSEAVKTTYESSSGGPSGLSVGLDWIAENGFRLANMNFPLGELLRKHHATANIDLIFCMSDLMQLVSPKEAMWAVKKWLECNTPQEFGWAIGLDAAGVPKNEIGQLVLKVLRDARKHEDFDLLTRFFQRGLIGFLPSLDGKQLSTLCRPGQLLNPEQLFKAMIICAESVPDVVLLGEKKYSYVFEELAKHLTPKQVDKIKGRATVRFIQLRLREEGLRILGQ